MSFSDKLLANMLFENTGRRERPWPKQKSTSSFKDVRRAIELMDFLEEHKKKKHDEKRGEKGEGPKSKFNVIQWFGLLTFFGPLLAIVYLYTMILILHGMWENLHTIFK